MVRNIYVIAGGTVVHVRPHFSICAPAYGQVGRAIYDRLVKSIHSEGWESFLRVYLVNTRMAGQNPAATVNRLCELGITKAPETNEDIRALTSALVSEGATIGIVMAAAICDFEPVELRTLDSQGVRVTAEFGKTQERLHHIDSLSLTMRASDKVIDEIKQSRPDIALATFKTTAGLPEEEIVAQALANLKRSRSDLVFANDLHNRQNLVVTSTGVGLKGGTRDQSLEILCHEYLRILLNKAR